MGYPERYHVDALRKLRGDAYVTFPSGDLTKPVVERVFSVVREKAASPDAFNSPQTSEYTGTELVEQHFVGGDAQYVEVYQKWETLPGTDLTTQSIGTPDSLIPAKYRSLIRTIESNQPVGPDYVFPAGLTGSQQFISLAMETLARRRKHILEQIIETSADPFPGGKTDEWGTLAVEESIVADTDPIDEGYLIKYSEVTAIGQSGLGIKITVRYPDDLEDKEHPGQTIDRQFNAALPFVEKLLPLGEGIGDNDKEIQPVDDYHARVKTYNDTALDAALGSFFRNFPVKIPNLNLPDVLESMEIIYEGSHGDGGYDESGEAEALGSSLSLHLQLNANAQASAVIMPDAQPNISQVWGHDVTGIECYLFLKDPISISSLLTTLGTKLGVSVTDWPIFRPVAHTITLKGERLSVVVNGNVQQHLSTNDSTDFGASYSHTKGSGAGSSSELGLTIRTIRIPPTIHGLITLSPTTETEPISAEASASMDDAGGTVLHWEAMDSPPAIESGVVHAGISPGSLAATSPAAIPSSGVKLKSIDISPYVKDWNKVRVVVFDFATL